MKEDDQINLAPEGYSTVSPYLMVESVEKEIDFLQNVFNAEITEEIKQSDESIMHGEVRIGNVVIMLGKAMKDNPPIKSMIYVFVESVDETYKRALELNATSIREPENQFYGFREAGIKDEQGNVWWIAQQIEKLSSEDFQQRMNELQKK